MKMKFVIVVDMQHDFVDGALGSDEAFDAFYTAGNNYTLGAFVLIPESYTVRSVGEKLVGKRFVA